MKPRQIGLPRYGVWVEEYAEFVSVGRRRGGRVKRSRKRKSGGHQILLVPVACKVNKYVTGLFVNIEFVEFNVVYNVPFTIREHTAEKLGRNLTV